MKKKVEFIADVSSFDHGIKGLDYSSPLNLATSLVGKPYTARQGGEQAVYDRCIGNEIELLPENKKLVSDGASCWMHSVVSRIRRIQENNGQKYSVREFVLPVSVKSVDTTEDLQEHNSGEVFYASERTGEQDAIAPDMSGDSEVIYARVGNVDAAARAKKYINNYIAGAIRERLKIIGEYDKQMMVEAAEYLKDKIDNIVLELS